MGYKKTINNGDMIVQLNAKKVQEYGGKNTGVWYKQWELRDQSGKRFGSMVWNSHFPGPKYNVFIDHPLTHELGTVASEQFHNKEHCLTWARYEFESRKPLTEAELQDLLVKIKDWRYQDEMSDDFAYTNGKIAKWARIEQMVMGELAKLT